MDKISFHIVPLKYFLDAVDQKGISKAAQLNQVSQSAVSQAIAKLERSLNCTLLNHQSNRFRVTAEGRKLYEHGKQIFQSILRAEEAFFDEERGTIRFACTLSFAQTFLPTLLKSFKTIYPTIHLQPTLAYPEEILELVKKGEVDFGIVLDNLNLSGFDREEVFRGHFFLYSSMNCHNPESQSVILDTDYRTETLLLKNAYEAHLKRDLPILMELSSWEVIANLTEKGLGIGFFPDYIACYRAIPLKPLWESAIRIPYRGFAIFPKHSQKSKSVLAVCHHLTSLF